MTGRRKGSGGPQPPAGGKEKLPEKITLPSSGLAEDILAFVAASSLAGGEASSSPAELDEGGREVLDGPDRLFSLADRLARRAMALPTEPPEEPETWVTFDVAGEVYALPVLCVEEVLRVTSITRLPYAPAPVRGITQLRGRVLPIVDLSVRLGAPPVAIGPQSRIVVVTARGRTLGLLVDAARQVIKLLPSVKEAPPPEVVSDQSDFLVAVVRRAESLVILLDVDRALLLPSWEDRDVSL